MLSRCALGEHDSPGYIRWQAFQVYGAKPLMLAYGSCLWFTCSSPTLYPAWPEKQARLLEYLFWSSPQSTQQSSPENCCLFSIYSFYQFWADKKDEFFMVHGEAPGFLLIKKLLTVPNNRAPSERRVGAPDEESRESHQGSDFPIPRPAKQKPDQDLKNWVRWASRALVEAPFLRQRWTGSLFWWWTILNYYAAQRRTQVHRTVKVYCKNEKSKGTV